MTTKKKHHKYLDRMFIRNALLMTGMIFAFLFFGGFAGLYRVVYDQNFADGVSIDGVDVSKMSYAHAEQVVAATAQEYLSNVNISLVYMGVTTVFDAQDLGVTLNEKEVLETAYGYNKSEADSIEERYNKTAALSRGRDFTTSIIIDSHKLRQTVEDYTTLYSEDAVDAKTLFDKDTCMFTYVKEEYGVKFDSDALVREIICMLNNEDYTDIQVPSEAILPNITEATLKMNTVQISQYETIAAENANRNINIQLMCDAVDGLEIKPGETLSINELVGERTEEKGFSDAPAIINGVVVDDIGGGICQLAGTLYNAALLTDLEIVERVKHTWPSSYLPIGQDATLNWDDKDLKIKNTTDYSIYISAVFEDQIVTVKIYGQPLAEGVTITVENDIVKEIPPAKTEYRYTSELPEGVRKTVRNPRNGYKVKVYRLYMKDGEVLHKILISSDTYSASNRLVYIGKNMNGK